ncbi:MAG: NAD-binding protein [Micromonosporaceae bacterium]
MIYIDSITYVPRRFFALRGHMIVCGDNELTYQLVEELTGRYHADVQVILPSKKRNHGPEIAAMANVDVIEADKLDESAFRAAQIETARAVALVAQDDVGNIHAALRAQEIRPDVRLVARVFNANLARRIMELLSDCTFLSDASIAAPAFVAASLGEVAPNHARLPGRTLHVTRRCDAPKATIICGVAEGDFSDSGSVLPADDETTDLVLAIADGAVREPLRQGRFRRLPHMVLWSWVREVFSRKLRIAAVALIGLLVAGSVAHRIVNPAEHWYDALYFTLLTSAGAGDPNLGDSVREKIIQVVLMLSGIALVPVVTAAVVDGVVSARLAVTRLRDSTAGHVVVVGLGNVGTRVVSQLQDLGLPVAAIELDEDARGVRVANDRKIPVIFGDATQEETLLAAKVDQCRALIAVTSDDVKNLETALHARSMTRDLRIVLRLFDSDLAKRIQRQFRIAASRSVSSLTAPHFALAMVQRRMFDTIPVGRQVLLFADFPINPGSVLNGQPISAAHIDREARVIALMPATEAQAMWRPPEDRVLGPGDRLVVLATRDGIGEMVTLTDPNSVVKE